MATTYVFTGAAGGTDWNAELDLRDNQGNIVNQRFSWTVYGDINNPASGAALDGLYPNDPLPTTSTDVQIGPAGGSQSYQVTLSEADRYGKKGAARNLSIAAGSSLTLLGNVQGPGAPNLVTILTVNGNIHNAGGLAFQTTAYHGSGILLQSNTTLDGGGTVTCGDINFYSNAGFFNASGNSVTLTNVDNTITGSGEISNVSDVGAGANTGTLTFVNHGVVNANATRSFLIDAGSATAATVNTGTFESTGTGGLVIQTPTLDNRGGTIRAADGATVTLNATRLIGGTLSSAGSGQIVLGGSQNILDGTQSNGAITNAATLVLNPLSSVVLRGGLTNNRLVEVNAAQHANATLLLDGDFVLDGSGTVQLQEDVYGPQSIVNVAGKTVTLTNSNTIAGNGAVGSNGAGGRLDLVNKGSIVADNAQLQLTINAATVANTGTIAGAGAAGLALSNTVLTTTGAGTVEARDGSHVDLASSTISGKLTTTGTGSIRAADSLSTLDNVALSGNLAIADRGLTVKDTFQNNGTVHLSAGSYSSAAFKVAGATTFSGTGTIDFSSTLAYSGVSLTNVDNQSATLTNAGTLTLTGLGGTILTNGAAFTILNTGTLAVAGGVSLNLGYDGPTVVNTGSLGTTGSGVLSIASTSIKNQGGTVSVGAGSHIDLSSNTIIFGGTLSSSGSGYIDTLDSTVTLGGASFGPITSTAQIRINDGTSLAIVGPFTNNGTIEVGAASGGQLYAGAAFTGSGSIVLTNAGSTITGGFTDAGNAISGRGTISASIDLEPGGSIDANVAGATLALTGTQAMTNNGLLAADGGLLSVAAAVSGTGTARVGSGGTLAFGAAFDENVDFVGTGTAETLLLAAGYGGTISGFGLGDKIDLAGVAYGATDRLSFRGGQSAGTLTLTGADGTTVRARLQVSGSSAGFALSDDGHGGTLITGTANRTTPVDAGGAFVDGSQGTQDLVGTVVPAFIATAGAFGSGTVLVDLKDGYVARGDSLDARLSNIQGVQLGADPSVVIGLAAATDLIYGGTGSLEFYNGGGTDYIQGSTSSNAIVGGTGVTIFYGTGGHDTMFGGTNQSFMQAGSSAASTDVFYGNGGTDFVYGGAGGTDLVGGSGTEVLTGGSGYNQLVGSSQSAGALNILNGGTGADVFFAGIGTNLLFEGTGVDVLAGNAGTDYIYGGAGQSFIYGGSGTDVVTTGAGNQYVHAGAGQTVFNDTAANQTAGRFDQIDNFAGGRATDVYMAAAVQGNTSFVAQNGGTAIVTAVAGGTATVFAGGADVATVQAHTHFTL